jgi:hypothetical protein
MLQIDGYFCNVGGSLGLAMGAVSSDTAPKVLALLRRPRTGKVGFVSRTIFFHAPAAFFDGAAAFAELIGGS